MKKVPVKVAKAVKATPVKGGKAGKKAKKVEKTPVKAVKDANPEKTPVKATPESSSKKQPSTQKGQQSILNYTKKRDKKFSQEESIEDKANPKEVKKYQTLSKKKASPPKKRVKK